MTLSQQRADYAKQFLRGRCDVKRAEPGTDDGYGGKSNRLQTVYRGLPCRVQRASRAQRITEGAQRAALGDWEVLLPIDTRVALSDQIIVDGQTYEVTSSDEGITEALYRTAYCSRRD